MTTLSCDLMDRAVAGNTERGGQVSCDWSAGYNIQYSPLIGQDLDPKNNYLVKWRTLNYTTCTLVNGTEE